mmetsp:Transcript_31419/g.51861  ORF Transcript_31419/g.51861 Transcript_31419/m.51861 type:complete len:230 (-) Transcript_31419:2256-2945(-)
MLEPIIEPCTKVVSRLGNERIRSFFHLIVWHLQHQTLLKLRQGNTMTVSTSGKTRIVALVHHNLHQSKGNQRILARRQESLDKELSKFFETVAVHTAHDFDIILSQLEGGTFKGKFMTRRHSHGKSKVNKDQMTSIVNHNVSIVTVLQPQQVHDERITTEGMHKVSLRVLKGQSAGVAVRLFKVGAEATFLGEFVRLFQSINRRGVRQDFNQTSILGGTQNTVSLEPNG